MIGKITISVCIIARNEEDVIERCINSFKNVADEIIVVDTGSKDCTRELAINSSDKVKVFDFQWCDDFSAARNFCFSKATKEYSMWADADDLLTEENEKKLLNLKNNFDKEIDSVTMIYDLAEDDEGNTISSLRRNRLVKSSRKFLWVGRIHEYFDVYGNIINADISVKHRKLKASGRRNLRIFEEMIKDNVEFTPRNIFYYGNELFYNGFYDKAIEQYNRFLDTKQGWIEDIKIALKNRSECYINLGDESGEINSLLEEFKYDVPRCDFCCSIAYYFFRKDRFKEAIFWYKLAFDTAPEKDSLNLIDHSMYTWVPAIQLCVCYSKIGDYDESNKYNEIAARYIPNSDMVIHNRGYLSDKISK